MTQNLFDLSGDVLSSIEKFRAQLGSDGAAMSPSELEKNSTDFMVASQQFSAAILGPRASTFAIATSQYDMLALQFLIEFNVLNHIDVSTGTPLEVIAKRCGIDENRAGRFLRMLVLLNFLVEDKNTAVFRLAPASLFLKEDKQFLATIGMLVDEMWKAAAFVKDALRKFPTSGKSEHSPWREAWGKPIYEWYGDQSAEKSVRFAAAMEGMASMEKSDSLLVDWTKSLKAKEGKIVDVGGGRGHIAIELANENPSLSFEVQDLSPVMFIDQSTKMSPDIRARVGFRQHDFFHPQPLPGPDDKPILGYILRRCLHNWVDEDAVKIMRSFVPALRANKTTFLVINETVMPEPGSVQPLEERLCRYFDIGMLVIGNARQRTETEWRALVKQTDDGLEVTGVQHAQNGGTMGLILVRYRG